MGNCQAVDAAALVIQHPSGKLERMYWPVTASEVMNMNPGHYVSLIIPLPVAGEGNQEQKTVQFTRVKLLRPSETLALGHAYRLVTTQEVMKVLRAKKYAKIKRQQPAESASQVEDLEKQSKAFEARRKSDSEMDYGPAAAKHEEHRHRALNSATLKSKSWRPTLQSISEAGS